MTNRKAVVFIPGLSYLSKMWDGVVTNMSNEKYDCHAITLMEYGTDFKGTHLNFDNYPDYINTMLQKKPLQPPYILVGQSLGGLITLKYAEKYPQNIDSIVLISTPLKRPDTKVRVYWKYFVALGSRSRVLGALVSNAPRALSHLARNPKVSDLIDQIGFLKVSSLKSVCLCYKDLFKTDFSPIIEGIEKPVLIVYGTKDKVMIQFGGIDLYGNFKNAVIKSFPCDHSVPERHPKELACQIQNFLEEHV